MTAGRKRALFLSLLAICWFATSSLIARDKEQTPETEQAKKKADRKVPKGSFSTPRTDEFRVQYNF